MSKNYYYKGWFIHFGFRDSDGSDIIMKNGLPGPNGPSKEYYKLCKQWKKEREEKQ